MVDKKLALVTANTHTLFHATVNSYLFTHTLRHQSALVYRMRISSRFLPFIISLRMAKALIYVAMEDIYTAEILPLSLCFPERCFEICSVIAANCTARGGQLKCSNAHIVESSFLMCHFSICVSYLEGNLWHQYLHQRRLHWSGHWSLFKCPLWIIPSNLMRRKEHEIYLTVAFLLHLHDPFLLLKRILRHLPSRHPHIGTCD